MLVVRLGRMHRGARDSLRSGDGDASDTLGTGCSSGSRSDTKDFGNLLGRLLRRRRLSQDVPTQVAVPRRSGLQYGVTSGPGD